jgi:hypothetical protein
MHCKMYICTLYPGAEFGITSDEFFLLKSRPEQVLVVGAGYIAVEMSQVGFYIPNIANYLNNSPSYSNISAGFCLKSLHERNWNIFT